MRQVNPVGRFAPSPTGNLHMGTLVTALGSWLRARQQNGRWLVRVDDLDPARTHAGAAERILDALRQCGLQADAVPLYQSSRLHAYQQALQQLRDRDLVFACWCSRRDLAEAGSVHRDGHCVRGKDLRRSPAWRLRVPAGMIDFDDLIAGPLHQDVRQTIGDFVLQRADGCWSYHLACAIDEACMNITEVVRGHDLLDSTPRQILLQQLLGLPSPRYAHLPLVIGNNGEKLSKSGNSANLDTADPVAALNAALLFLGQQPSLSSGMPLDAQLHAAASSFDIRRIPRAAVTRQTSGA